MSGITYVAIATGFVYLAVLLDAWSRRVVGDTLDRKIDAPPTPEGDRLPASNARLRVPFGSRFTTCIRAAPGVARPKRLLRVDDQLPMRGQNERLILSNPKGALHRKVKDPYCECRTNGCKSCYGLYRERNSRPSSLNWWRNFNLARMSPRPPEPCSKTWGNGAKQAVGKGRKQLKLRVEESEAGIDGVVDRIVETPNSRFVSTHQVRISQLQEEAVILKEELADSGKSPPNLETYSNPPSLPPQVPVIQRGLAISGGRERGGEQSSPNAVDTAQSGNFEPHMYLFHSRPWQTRMADMGFGAPDRIRTCDLRLRRPTLYPAELLVPNVSGWRLLIPIPACLIRRNRVATPDPAGPTNRLRGMYRVSAAGTTSKPVRRRGRGTVPARRRGCRPPPSCCTARRTRGTWP